jgi:hypothetical protein
VPDSANKMAHINNRDDFTVRQSQCQRVDAQASVADARDSPGGTKCRPTSHLAHSTIAARRLMRREVLSMKYSSVRRDLGPAKCICILRCPRRRQVPTTPGPRHR